MRQFAGLPVNVLYAPPPPEAVLRSPFPFENERKGSHKRYATKGYTRQLWDTFVLDLYLPAHATPDDILGITDVDAPFTAPLLHAGALLDRRGKLVRVTSGKPTLYGGDALFIKERAPLDSMMALQMPQVFWVRTLPAFRGNITARYRQPNTVDGLANVWAKFCGSYTGSRRYLSPNNAVMNWAVAHEPEDYAMVTAGRAPAFAVFASNKPPSQKSMRAGCCRAHGAGLLPGCTSKLARDAAHITVSLPKWAARDREVAATAAYRGIKSGLAQLPDEVRGRMVAACAREYGLGKGGGTRAGTPSPSPSPTLTL